MNLVELSEKLKDVPDQFLLKEVQNPTGSYPSYLVVSELTRRKKMRDKAQQVPQTSVAEDVARDTAQHNQQQQMQQQQQQMMQQQAGLGALPEAQESTAGRDALQIGAAEGQDDTQNMASGGLVAFAGGQGVTDPLARYRSNPFAYNDQGGLYQTQTNNPYSLGYEEDIKDVAKKIRAFKPKTKEEELAIRQAGIEERKAAIPFRGDLYDEDISRQEKGMKSAKSDAASDSLIQAGLAIIGSRKPGLQGISEGGLKGFQTYIDAKKDIKNSERLLFQSKKEKANAQTLYDQGNYEAGNAAMTRADANEARAQALAGHQLDSFNALRNVNKDNMSFPLQMQAAKRAEEIGTATQGDVIKSATLKNLETQADIRLKDAQAVYYRDGKGKVNKANPGEIKTSMDIAAAALLQQNVMPTDPNYNMKLYGLTAEILSKTGNALDFGLFNSLLTGGRSVPTPSNAPAPAASSSAPYASPLANTSYNNRIGNAATGGGNPIYNQRTIDFSGSDLGKIIKQMNQNNGNR